MITVLSHQADDNYKWTKLVIKFHWIEQLNVEFKTALKLDTMSLKISDCLNTKFENLEKVMEKANKAFRDTLINGAKMSLAVI